MKINKNMRLKAIKQHINSNFDIYFYDELKSTNSSLKELAENGAKEGTIVIALKQSEGRGTQGRKFYSPLNGIYMSMLIKSKQSQPIFLTVSIAVAVISAIKKVTGLKCGIKWVNDIFLNNKKIGGILTEGVFNRSSNKLEYAVVGVGINISVPHNGFDKDIKNIAGALYNNEIDDKIYCKLVAEIIRQSYKQYKQVNRKKLIRKYQSYSILINRDISFVQNNETHIGKVVRISKNGKLVVNENGKNVKLSAGDVKILKL
ncbi:MAG: biotin--[Clostridia bacterium]|nr:biotin--[acetyl-CoA-carboxylase] ligase [Clostridia bacterium]